MSIASLLIDLANVTRTTNVADGSGGWTSSESIILRRIACRFNAMSASELALYADKLGTLAGFTVYAAAELGILEGDVLVRVADGRKFDVLLVRNYDEKNLYVAMTCRERARAVEP